MTSQQDRILLRSELETLLGPDRTATLWSMLREGDDLATRSDVALVRDELTGEIGSFRDELKGEMATLRSEMNQFVRTFIAVQTGTVVGVAGIVFAIVRLG